LKRRLLLAGVTLLSLAVHLALAVTWSRLGVLDQHDVLFDADPVVAVGLFRDGEMLDRLWRPHPNLRNLGHSLVLLLAAPMQLVLSPDEARHQATLALAPLAAAASTAATFLACEALGASPAAAALVALLQAFSFSSLVFGSMPESYPLSGALLAFAWLLAARALRDGRLRAPAWVLTTSVALGVTITNGVLALLPLLFVEARRRSWRHALRSTLAVAAAAVVLAFVQLAALNAAFGEGVPGLRAWRRQDPFLAARPLDTAAEYPRALAATLLAGPPRRVATEIAERRGYRYKQMFTINGPEPAGALVLRLAVVAGALAVGARRLARGAGAPLLAAASATLAFNGAVHAVYRGSDLLLYSQHWLAALVMLASGLALGSAGERRALAALAAATAIYNLAVLGMMVLMLAAT
jgi:hypothetical protein